MSEKKKNKISKDNVIIVEKDTDCPVKDGDNCLVPGVYSDSEPIGGGG